MSTNAVTVPLHHRYITVTLPLHYRYVTVTGPGGHGDELERRRARRGGHGSRDDVQRDRRERQHAAHRQGNVTAM